MEIMNKAWEVAAQEMYAASGGAQAGEKGGPQAGGALDEDPNAAGADSDVSDVEYEDLDDKESK